MMKTFRLVCFAALTYLVACGSHAQAVLTDNWKFDEAAGSNAANSATGTRPGTLTAFTSPGTTWGPGRFGNSLGFDHANAVVQLNAGQAPTGANWTAGGWYLGLAPSNGSFHTLFRGNPNDHHVLADPSHVLGTYNNTVAPNFFTSGFDMDPSAAVWTQIMAVGSGGTTNFYINGLPVGTSAMQITSGIFAIGNYQLGGQLWSDRLDDVGVFNQAFTDPMVRALYSLAQTPTLDFPLSDATQLIDLFNAAGNTVLPLGGANWVYATGLTGTPGVVQFTGIDVFGNEGYILPLDEFGNGLVSALVPEPSSAMLLGLGLVGMAIQARRRRQRAAA